MSASAAVDELAASSEAEVLALWARRDGGELAEDQFVILAAASVARHNAQAVALADLVVATSLTSQLARPVPPVGLPLIDHQPRLRDAIRTVIAEGIASVETAREKLDSVAARLSRLARAEPARVAQSAMQQAMRRHPAVAGWTRGLSSKPCPLCRQWADGKIRSADIPMNRHAGCSCVPQPAVSR